MNNVHFNSISGSLVDSATGKNLDNLAKSVGVEPQPVKWTTEMADRGVELEVGMLCNHSCWGKCEVEVIAIGKRLALVLPIDAEEGAVEVSVRIYNLVPIELRSKKELALEKQRNRLSAFFMDNCDMEEVEFIQAMQDAGLLAEIEE